MFGFFTRWNGPVEYIYESVQRAESRLMLHISTQDGYGTPEAFTPREIANGEGDGYLIRTNRRIAEYGQPTYVRFLAEMNQANNGYCAYNHNGSSRGPSHSTSAFKQAWRRATLILRGGPVASINAALDRLGLPPVDLTEDLPGAAARDAVGAADGGHAEHPRQPRPRVLAGSEVRRLGRHRLLLEVPELHRPRDLLRRFPGQAVRVRRVGAVGRRQPRLRAPLLQLGQQPQARADAVYNQGNTNGGPFRLSRYPESRKAIAKALKRKRFLGKP